MKKQKDTTKSGRHHFKWLNHQGQKIRIDRDIAPLLTEMWALGIQTTNSCQGVCSTKCKHKLKIKKLKGGNTLFDKVLTPECRSYVWIAFQSAKDMERFYNLVAVYEKQERDQPVNMYAIINGWAGKDVKRNGKFVRWERHPDNWEVVNHMPNNGIRGHEEKGVNNIPGKPKFFLYWEEDDCSQNDFRMEPQVKFPRKHLQYVMERLQVANSKRK
jgi:hypothetical protein